MKHPLEAEGSLPKITGVKAASDHDIDIVFTVNYDRILAVQAKNLLPGANADQSRYRAAVRYAMAHELAHLHLDWMLRTQLPRLTWCEMLIGMTAPKGRIDEYIGDHQEELANLMARFGVRKAAWIRRYRLITTTFRMVPTMIVRAIRLFYSAG